MTVRVNEEDDMASKSKVSKVASKTGRRASGKVASGPGKVKSKKKTVTARERERKTAPRRRPQPKPPEIPAIPAPVAAVPATPAATEHGAVPHGLDQHVSEPGGGAGENAPSMQPPPEEPAHVQDPSPSSGT